MTYRTPLTLLFAAGLALGGQARAEGTLHFANWSDYYPPELLKKFEKDTGIKATLDAYDSNETLLAKLKAGGGAYDVVVPSDSFIEIFVKEGLLQKLDKSQLPSLGNLKENFRTLGFDPGHDYSIPYLWGTTGYSYDTAKVPGGRLEESWKPFFEPPAELKGKVVALNSIEELFIPPPTTSASTNAPRTPGSAEGPRPAAQAKAGAGHVQQRRHHRAHGRRRGRHAPAVERRLPPRPRPTRQPRIRLSEGRHPAVHRQLRDSARRQQRQGSPRLHRLDDAPGEHRRRLQLRQVQQRHRRLEKFMEKALFDDPAINTPQDKLDRLKPFKLCSPKALALRSKVWTKLKK